MQKPILFNVDEFVKPLDNFRSVHLGLTGSGKTYLIKKLISRINTIKKWNVMIHDAKPELPIKKFGRDILTQKTFMRRVFELSLDGIKITSPNLIAEFVCAMAWQFKPSVVYLEEAAGTIDKDSVHFAQNHPLIYKCLQQGRSRGVSVIISTQMITQLNLAFFRQASHVFLHWMKPAECRWVEEQMGLEKGVVEFNEYDPNNSQDPHLHQFYIWKAPNNLVFYNPVGTRKSQNAELESSDEYEEPQKEEE